MAHTSAFAALAALAQTAGHDARQAQDGGTVPAASKTASVAKAAPGPKATPVNVMMQPKPAAALPSGDEASINTLLAQMRFGADRGNMAHALMAGFQEIADQKGWTVVR